MTTWLRWQWACSAPRARSDSASCSSSPITPGSRWWSWRRRTGRRASRTRTRARGAWARPCRSRRPRAWSRPATRSSSPRSCSPASTPSVAGEVETALANKGHAVVSNSRNHRMDPDVPLLIPEVNADHLDALAVQRKRTGGGYIVTNPNCSVVGLAMALAPLQRAFGLYRGRGGHAAGALRRGLSRRRLHGHRRQRDPVHRRRRGGEDRDGAAAHPGHASRAGPSRTRPSASPPPCTASP